MEANGSLATLRHGFKCYGRTLFVAYFKAAHELNPELEERYAKNRLGLTRQLRFSARSEKSLDVTLSVNGIPIATLELKNAMTGQTVEHARRQYKQDRDPRETIFEFKKRTLVHFAVDTDAVLMTTRLAGGATHFLPFNKGDGGGAGNPADPQGRSYRTAYLWEEVLGRDSLLDLLARFLHLQVDEKRDDQGRKVKTEQMVFPRYHQLQAVRFLVESARTEGPGHNYLVEHSAGSGKSNTIAWLTHRLASLHDESNRRVFDSVIVVTDRVVLDQQLQDNIYQFEHKRGVVQKIDESSRQLAEALESAVPIIITTLQKFPFVSRQLLKMAEERGEAGAGTLQTRRCAVVIDEAHSSQGGETATDLKEVLGGDALRKEAHQRAAEEGREDLEELFRSMAKRGQQANLSFFAFTATPKHKTLAVFGRRGKAAHRYTMRQAIEEGFILDVLKSYTTYATYYRLLKSCDDDPNVERKKAARALARFLKLHPHNIAQKTEVMVEHFHAVTRHKIGGRAKAMVVTGSRLEAVRYKQSFDKYIRDKGYPIKSLVAFSGTVADDKLPDTSYTEEGMNGIREKELPERFGSPEYQVLLVAEKYQTGFDQPLLHTMYVDKRLAGIQAVQTLSRLNRIHPVKEDTFVLDFVNDRDEIREAFKTYYEGAEIGDEVDPARLYAIKGELDTEGIYLDEEIARFCDVYFKPKQKQSALDHQAMNAALDPAVSRFKARSEAGPDEAELWRGKLQAFQNLYGFLSQVIPYQDSDLERLYVFVRHLMTKLPRRASSASYQFDDEVKLEYYRLQKISEGSIALKDGDARKLDGPAEVGSGVLREQPVPLSQLIDVVNERFGTDFNQGDQLFFDQIVEAAMSDDGLRRAASVNPGEKFELLFKNVLERLFVDRMDQNEDIFVRFMNDVPFQKVVTSWMAEEAYRRLRAKDGSSQSAAEPKLRLVEGAAKDRYVKCVPLVPLKVAAGAFSDPQHVADDDFEWVEVESERRLRPGMFVAQVVGHSMEPGIEDGAYCLFAAPVTGSRQGRTVLVQLRDATDPETGHRYTVKRYESEKARAGDSWRHTKITLKPTNPAYAPIVIEAVEEDAVQVIAELVEVLGTEGPVRS
ncbi:MAG: DEAD/DEAH box helicase family protein [Polyangiaceae bacterium]